MQLTAVQRAQLAELEQIYQRLHDLQVLPRNLRHLRHMRGMRASDVAAAIGVSQRTYSEYEAGRRPKVDIVQRLAALYDWSIDDLMANHQYPDHRGTRVRV